MNKKNIYFLLFFVFCLKILFAAFFPVFADEAYYSIWALRPQLSYFDHPAMVGWLIYLNKQLLPVQNALGLRFIFILAGTLTSIVWVFILRKKMFSERQVFYFIALISLNPLLGVGSVVATPDVPLVLFWSLSYLAYLNLFDSEKNKKIFAFIFLGLFLGLGFCSKYHIVLFVFSGLIGLLLSKDYKKLWFPGILLTLFFGLMASLPVLIWNQQNDWASFTYQLKHGFGKTYYDWNWTVQFILGQALIMSPFVFLALFKKQADSKDQIFSLSQLLFFLTSSFKAIVEANWPITSHTHATANFSQNASEKKIHFTLVYWLFIYLSLFIYLKTPWAEKTLRNQYRSSQTIALAKLVEKYKPLYGPSYQISALLTWQTQHFVPKLRGLSRYDFYDTLPESVPTEKTIFVLKHFDSIWPDDYKIYNKTRLESFDNMQIELYQLSYE